VWNSGTVDQNGGGSDCGRSRVRQKADQQIAKDYRTGQYRFLFGPMGAGYAIQMFEGTTPN
jgi:hypothetical protein